MNKLTLEIFANYLIVTERATDSTFLNKLEYGMKWSSYTSVVREVVDEKEPTKVSKQIVGFILTDTIRGGELYISKQQIEAQLVIDGSSTLALNIDQVEEFLRKYTAKSPQ